MIVKHFQLNEKNLLQKNFFLIYGNNRGLIQEITHDIIKTTINKNVHKYQEDDILKNENDFLEKIFNKSFFDNDKIFIIKKSTDKILNIIEKIVSKNLSEIFFIFLSETLEKKSKLRNFFEKDKKLICIPVYEDNLKTLNDIAIRFINENKINISRQAIDVITQRASGDRINLINELNKIESYTTKKKKINLEDVLKITNLTDNYSISHFVDQSLLKNKNRMKKILNENIFNTEDCIVIIKTFLLKLKKLKKIKRSLIEGKNIDYIFSTYKPPIFWMDKETIQNQLKELSLNQINLLIKKINILELLIKKNSHISKKLINNFILERSNY